MSCRKYQIFRVFCPYFDVIAWDALKKKYVLKYYLFVFTGGMGRGRSLFPLDSDDDRARELEFARDLGVMAP